MIDREANKTTPPDTRRELRKKAEQYEQEAFEIRVLLAMLAALDLVDEKGKEATSNELSSAVADFEPRTRYVLLTAFHELEQLGVIREVVADTLLGLRTLRWEVIESTQEKKP